MSILSIAVTLKDLPPPPIGKTGWPWTEQTEPLDSCEFPQISIVTPSYNQGQFIEETIRSVLLQGYPNLEYIIIDGGSTDNTLEIIKKYEAYLAYWVSERDRGQSDALNKGFRRATGQLMGWQNSDDTYQPRAFFYAADRWKDCPQVDVIYGNTNVIDERSHILQPYPIAEAKLENMIPHPSICNQSAFYSDRIFKESNYIDESLQHCMDQEFLLRLLVKKYQFAFEPRIIGNFRTHPSAKTSKQANIWSEEVFNLYKAVYQNTCLSPEARDKARECLYGICRDDFGKLRLKLFRKTVWKLIGVLGWRSLNTGLVLKYLVSFLGTDAIAKIRSLKQL
jgi:glycosyltransferase involved in cell wall biosynthesis